MKRPTRSIPDILVQPAVLTSKRLDLTRLARAEYSVSSTVTFRQFTDIKLAGLARTDNRFRNEARIQNYDDKHLHSYMSNTRRGHLR